VGVKEGDGGGGPADLVVGIGEETDPHAQFPESVQVEGGGSGLWLGWRDKIVMSAAEMHWRLVCFIRTGLVRRLARGA
jgi:hypothetical protein